LVLEFWPSHYCWRPFHFPLWAALARYDFTAEEALITLGQGQPDDFQPIHKTRLFLPFVIES
jgi:hypothetical protein